MTPKSKQAPKQAMTVKGLNSPTLWLPTQMPVPARRTATLSTVRAMTTRATMMLRVLQMTTSWPKITQAPNQLSHRPEQWMISL